MYKPILKALYHCAVQSSTYCTVIYKFYQLSGPWLKDTTLPSINLYWYTVLTKFQGDNFSQSEVINCEMNMCGRHSFTDTVIYVYACIWYDTTILLSIYILSSQIFYPLDREIFHLHVLPFVKENQLSLHVHGKQLCTMVFVQCYHHFKNHKILNY